MHPIYANKCVTTAISSFSVDGEDYDLSYPSFLTLINKPVLVNVTLLNDGVTGERLETINLTLVQNQHLTPSNENQILAYETVMITLHDSDSMYVMVWVSL